MGRWDPRKDMNNQREEAIPRSQQKVLQLSGTVPGRGQRVPRSRAKIREQPAGWDRRTAFTMFGDDLLGLDVQEAEARLERKRSKTPKTDAEKKAKVGVRLIPKGLRHLLAGGFAGARPITVCVL
jgi:uncharacterized iron-regulated protein